MSQVKIIPGVENKETNAMATLASLLQLEQHESRFEFLVQELHHPIYDFQIQDNVPIQVDFLDDHLTYMVERSGRCSLMDPL